MLQPGAEPRRGPSFAVAITVAVVGLIGTTGVLVTGGLGSERALPAPAIEPLGGSYRFAMTQKGSDEPVGWDPCQPVQYQVNSDGAPNGGAELIERAVERMSDATGLVFEDRGTTDRRPFTVRFVPFGTEQPVVIGWATPAELPALSGDIAGIGGGAAEAGIVGRSYYVTGAIALDTEAFTEQQIASSPRIMEAIVLHELAHVVGLDHVEEPMELMAATNDGQVNLGPGDREGLARLGSLPCA